MIIFWGLAGLLAAVAVPTLIYASYRNLTGKGDKDINLKSKGKK